MHWNGRRRCRRRRQSQPRIRRCWTGRVHISFVSLPNDNNWHHKFRMNTERPKKKQTEWMQKIMCNRARHTLNFVYKSISGAQNGRNGAYRRYRTSTLGRRRINFMYRKRRIWVRAGDNIVRHTQPARILCDFDLVLCQCFSMRNSIATWSGDWRNTKKDRKKKCKSNAQHTFGEAFDRIRKSIVVNPIWH